MWHMTADQGICKPRPSCANSHWPVSRTSWTGQNQRLTTVRPWEGLYKPIPVSHGAGEIRSLPARNPGQRPKFSPFNRRPRLSPSRHGGKSTNTQAFPNSDSEADERWVELATQRVRPRRRHKRSWFSSFPDNFHCLSLLEFVGGLQRQRQQHQIFLQLAGLQQRESGNSCTGGSGLGSSAGRISVRAVSGTLASPRAMVTQLFHNAPNGLVSWGWSEARSYLVTSLNSSLAQLQISFRGGSEMLTDLCLWSPGSALTVQGTSNCE